MHGQNLSLQVHPLTEYIQSHFHMHYTQDESYYLLDAAGEAPCVYLGIKAGTKPEEMIDALQTAQNGGKPFPAEKFVNKIPVKKHDHVLIPAGTVHWVALTLTASLVPSTLNMVQPTSNGTVIPNGFTETLSTQWQKFIPAKTEQLCAPVCMNGSFWTHSALQHLLPCRYIATAVCIC